MEIFAKKMFKTQWDFMPDEPSFVGITPLISCPDLHMLEVYSRSTSLTNTPQYAAEKEDLLSFYMVRNGAGVKMERTHVVNKVVSNTGLFFDEGQHYKNSASKTVGDGFVMSIPKKRLLADIPNLHDLLDQSFNRSSEPLRLMQSLVDSLSNNPPLTDPKLIETTGDYLVDLVTLMLGKNKDAIYLAKMRGLRAARLTEIVSYIDQNFSDPHLSGESIAAHLGVSERYVQSLMEESGRTLSGYLQGLRLKKAFAMLSDPATRAMRVSDIAYACGFNDISTFNRAFRRHFGESPRTYRQ